MDDKYPSLSYDRTTLWIMRVAAVALVLTLAAVAVVVLT